jgi:hypothetical protein
LTTDGRRHAWLKKVQYSNHRKKCGGSMVDMRNLAKTLKAARLMHQGKSTEGHNILKNLRAQDLHDAARFVQEYPLIAEIMMRAEVINTPIEEIYGRCEGDVSLSWDKTIMPVCGSER